MRETDRESGSIPEGIQAASMLCDQDRDDFIRPVSFSLPPPPSVFAFPQLYIKLRGSSTVCQVILLVKQSKSGSQQQSESLACCVFMRQRGKKNPNLIQPLLYPDIKHTKCQKNLIGWADSTGDVVICFILPLCLTGQEATDIGVEIKCQSIKCD